MEAANDRAGATMEEDEEEPEEEMVRKRRRLAEDEEGWREEEEMEEERYEDRYRMTREHIPWLSYDSVSELDEEDYEILYEYLTPYHESDLQFYQDEVEALAEEEILLSNFERLQAEDDRQRDMQLLANREKEEWPEDMRRQYDETEQQARRRQLILSIVRHFLFH